jgi:hypothetical protein
MAADITPDRGFASIAVAAWMGHDEAIVEVIDHRPGAGWVVARLAELYDRWRPTLVVLDRASPAGKLAMDLEVLGIPLESTDAGTYAGACGGFYDAVLGGTIYHRGQPLLDAAVAAARKRNIGDTWAWARREGADVSPLVAATLARHGLYRVGNGSFRIF